MWPEDTHLPGLCWVWSDDQTIAVPSFPHLSRVKGLAMPPRGCLSPSIVRRPRASTLTAPQIQLPELNDLRVLYCSSLISLGNCTLLGISFNKLLISSLCYQRGHVMCEGF